MKTLPIGGLVGLLVGIAVAEWLGTPNDAAYYSVLAFGAIVGSVLAKLLFGKGSSPDD